MELKRRSFPHGVRYALDLPLDCDDADVFLAIALLKHPAGRRAARTQGESVTQLDPSQAADSDAQPAPVPNDRPSIHDLVIADMEERKALGKRRYNSLLQAGNGRDALVDLYQELLDACAYARQMIEERNTVTVTCDQAAAIRDQAVGEPREEKLHLIAQAVADPSSFVPDLSSPPFEPRARYVARAVLAALGGIR